MRARYYSDNVVSDKMTSSHWAEQHTRATVSETNGEFVLSGDGFGYTPLLPLKGRLFSWLTIALYLMKLSGRIAVMKNMRRAMLVAKKMGHPFTYDCFRALCTYTFYIQGNAYSRIAIIGDGWGYLSGLIHEFCPDTSVFLIDLGKTLTFQVATLSKAFPSAPLHLVEDGPARIAEPCWKGFVFCPAEKVWQLKMVEFDLFINIASMQEMAFAIISEYFDFIRSTLKARGLFYCCNRQEKTLPCGEILKIDEYPWKDNDTVRVSEVCPWYTFFLNSYAAARGLTLMGRRVPYVNYFDGPILHRLVEMERVHHP
jgi:hypothetical protein